MEKWFRARFQPNLPLEGEKRVTACPGHIALSRRAAEEGMVLLKNLNGYRFLSSFPAWNMPPLRKGRLSGKPSFRWMGGSLLLSPLFPGISPL